MSGFPKRLSRQLQKRWSLAHEDGIDRAAKMIAIDESIRNKYEHTVAPIVIDMAGFTARAREFGILHYLAMVEMMRTTLQPIVESNHGTVVKTEADNLFAHFPSPAKALHALGHVNKATRKLNQSVDDSHRIDLSVGVGYGPTLLTQADMWGSDFNMACKLGEDIAQTGEILFSENAWRQLRAKREIFEERSFVVAGHPVNAYSLQLGGL